MNEDAPTMSAGTGGFSGSANAKGPVAGFDPVMKFRKKVQKRKKIKEATTCPRDNHKPSRLFQYKVKIPGVGETIIFANNPAELKMKLRMSIMPHLRSSIEIERILPVNAAKYFMNRRMNAMKNVDEELEQKFKNQQAQQKIAIEKKKIQLKKQQLQKQLQVKTQSLKKQARAGAEQDETR
tara:strand:+ start:259 stop:801 length:543 start_codon:yes stop_codon:yes gene_type:complete